MSKLSPFRIISWMVLLFAAIGIAAQPAVAADAADAKRPRVVVAVFTKDASRQQLLMHNLQNIVADRPQATVEVVAFGPGLSLVTRKVDGSDNSMSKSVAALSEAGVKFLACGHTMRAMKVSKEDLLPNVGTVPSGIVHVVDRQQEGWAYFAP